jgi:broad specificity polyphosphatase/5'/3'-nucleotidase SurE
VIAAPIREQSAQLPAITLARPLRHSQHEQDECSLDGGCVYLGLYERPISAEYTLGTSVFYSGRTAAARAAALPAFSRSRSLHTRLYVSVTLLALDSTNADHRQTTADVANALPYEGDNS